LSQKLPYRNDQLIDALNSGKPILLFDSKGREGETDIFFLAKGVTDSSVRFLRKKGGGMIFLASEFSISKNLGLPFVRDIYESLGDISNDFEILRKLSNQSIPYDKRSSFSIFINHKNTFTGITDKDRALTARSFSDLCENSFSLKKQESQEFFSKNFRSPGHVPICIADSALLEGRQGHTELIVALLAMLNLPPIALGCEMLSDDGNSLSLKEAKAWALEQGYLFLEGQSIVEACQ